jgi:hypothetical protein
MKLLKGVPSFPVLVEWFCQSDESKVDFNPG